MLFIAILAILVLGPPIAWRVYRWHSYAQTTKEFVNKPFVCPNCGHRFYTKQRIIQPISENKAYLKCPNCGTRDFCGRPYDFEK